MIQRLAILGFGNMEFGGAIAASIANFWGERPLEIRSWDPNKERSDVMCRVLRYFLKSNGLVHQVYSMGSFTEATFEPDAVIICLGKESGGDDYEGMLRTIRQNIPAGVPIFDVCSEAYQGWPVQSETPNLDSFKFQTLRWINREEYPSQYIYAERESPLVIWLNTH